jgi:hypothetical protein
MNEQEERIVKSFELHARSPDKVPYIMVKEQIAVMELIRKDLDKIRKEIVQLRADVKQNHRGQIDDGK